MPIQTKRIGSDNVEISADDRVYYEVSYNAKTQKWNATQYHRGLIGLGTKIGDYATAEDAVSKVKAMLQDKEAELTAALDKLL